MAFSENWSVLEPDIETVFAHETNPLQALADARIAGIALRGVYNPDQCSGLMQRFVERGMMRDPEHPTPEENLPSRIDIGSSLVNRARGGLAVSDDPSDNKDAFLQHSARTHELFSHLFDGFDNPVNTLYDCLSALAVNKEVKVAREPDGRLYGPAIFRIHYEGHAYSPHINHVAIDDKLFNFEVSRFTHQFAGLICIQNSVHDGDSPHAVMHRCTWSPEVQAHLSDGTYHEYAAQTKIEQQQIEVQPG